MFSELNENQLVEANGGELLTLAIIGGVVGVATLCVEVYNNSYDRAEEKAYNEAMSYYYFIKANQ